VCSLSSLRTNRYALLLSYSIHQRDDHRGGDVSQWRRIGGHRCSARMSSMKSYPPDVIDAAERQGRVRCIALTSAPPQFANDPHRMPCIERQVGPRDFSSSCGQRTAGPWSRGIQHYQGAPLPVRGGDRRMRTKACGPGHQWSLCGCGLRRMSHVTMVRSPMRLLVAVGRRRGGVR
jgi:hypothetical protein